MLEVSEKEEGMSQYQDWNPVPTSPLVDDLATEPLAPVLQHHVCKMYYM